MLDGPGKRTLTLDLMAVQQRADGDAGARQGTDVHAAAKLGLQEDGRHVDRQARSGQGGQGRQEVTASRSPDA
jgi:hypothetical protein